MKETDEMDNNVQTSSSILTPIMQAGFAGFSAILIGVIVWQQSKVFTVIENNTRALYELKAEIDGK